MTKEKIKFRREIFFDKLHGAKMDNHDVEKKPLDKEGYGTVFKGTNEKTGEPRPIKKLSREGIEEDDLVRFLRELNY